jgi:2-keto-4-pentenoate hydratase/2-oxohepta-3-ene-1,7-dioic acid hydratase in catechol pathway
MLNDQERQNYPITDMIFTPAELISAISHDMTLLPGDVIACGTSVGVGTMRPGDRITIEIEGVCSLSNPFE